MADLNPVLIMSLERFGKAFRIIARDSSQLEVQRYAKTCAAECDLIVRMVQSVQGSSEPAPEIGTVIPFPKDAS